MLQTPLNHKQSTRKLMPTTTATTTHSNSKSGFKNSVSNILHKWRAVFKALSHDTLNQLENNSSDEQIDALFNSNNFDHNIPIFNKMMLGRDADSGASMSQTSPVGSSQLEMKLTDEQSEENSTSLTSTHNGHSNKTNNVNEQESFDNYDDVKICQKLRNQSNEPFYNAEEIWNHRRDLWKKRTNDMTIENIDRRRHVFKQIPTEYYNRVYSKLVVDDKPLRQPLNLEDALKVINSGWTETKKWERAANGLA